MEINSTSMSEGGILLAGGDAVETTTAKLFETSSDEARSEDHMMSGEATNITSPSPAPSSSPQDQLVCIKQEPISSLISPQTPEPTVEEPTVDGVIPQTPTTDIDAEEAILAQLGPQLLGWHENQEEAEASEPTEPPKEENKTMETKDELVEEDMFVDELPVIPVADAEGEDLIFLGGQVPQYAWASIDDETELSARIVEEAVNVALAAGQQVANILRGSAMRETRVNVSHWVKEFESIKETHNEFKVHVGVSGATGAGKTTMINALLDYDELLPSGSDGAATASACVVHLNADDRPDKRFRAVIRFKTQQEIRNWLEPILDDVKGYYKSRGMDVGNGNDRDSADEARKSRFEIKSRSGDEEEEEDSERDDDYVDSDEDNETDDGTSTAPKAKGEGRLRKTPVYIIDDNGDDDYYEDDDDYEVDESELRDKLMSLTAVFGLDLEDLRDIKVGDLLDRDEHPIARFLETTKEVFSGTKNDFARKIRPYLDCSPLPDDELPSGSDNEGDGDDDDSSDSDSSSDADSDDDKDNDQDSSDKDAGKAKAKDDISGGFSSMLGRQRKTTNLQVWPLVSHVDLYVPSKMLEGGIVLEDLPGLADQMEERVKIAQNRFRNLDATIIVAPAIRAGDETTCMQLISENEALRMRLDNQLNQRTFCVVTSRIDDFDWHKYLNQTNGIDRGSDLGRGCCEFEMLLLKISSCEKEISDVKEVLAAGEVQMEMAGIADDEQEMEGVKKTCSAWEIRLEELKAQQVLLKDAETYYRGLLAYHASQLRNRRVQVKIQKAYARKRASAISRTARKAANRGGGQQKGAKPKINDQAKAATLDVLPISALAYWKTQNSKTNKVRDNSTSAGLEEGFPQAVYTGIPALRAWIRYAVVPMRIRHGKSLLRRLDVLLHNLKTGFDMQQPTLSKIANPNKFLTNLLFNFQDTLILNLKIGSEELVKRMRECNPLQKLKGEHKYFRPKCRDDMIEVVEHWDCRNHPLEDSEPKTKRGRSGKKRAGISDENAQVPEGHILGPNGKPVKIAWATHLAIIRRCGAEYISGGSYHAKYNWMGGLARLSLSEVVEQWEACFHNEIPKEADNARVYLEDIWSRSLKKIKEVLPICCSDPSESGYLSIQLEALMAIRDSVIDGVQRAMLMLTEQAKGVHPIVEDILTKGWKRAFKEATEMSGKGSFKMRQKHLVEHAYKVTTGLVKKAIQSMDQQIAANVEAFSSQLEDVWNQTQQMIQNHVSSMVRTMDPTAAVDAGRPNDPLSNDRCRVINDHIFEWETNWKFSDVQTKMSLDGNGMSSTALPEQYLPKPEHFDELGLSAAEEEEVANYDYNDLELDEIAGPKRQRKTAVDKPCGVGRDGKGKARGKGKMASAAKKTPAKRRAPRKKN